MVEDTVSIPIRKAILELGCVHWYRHQEFAGLGQPVSNRDNPPDWRWDRDVVDAMSDEAARGLWERVKPSWLGGEKYNPPSHPRRHG